MEGGQPHFLPDGEILFRRNEGASTADGSLGFIYRVRPDGSGLRKAVEQPVNQFNFSSPVSPDGRWVFGWGPLGGHGPAAGQAYSLDGKTPISLGGLGQIAWAAGGALLSITGSPRAFFVPLAPGQMLPPIPAGGFQADEEIARLPGAHPHRGSPGHCRSLAGLSTRSIAATHSGISTASPFHEPCLSSPERREAIDPIPALNALDSMPPAADSVPTHAVQVHHLQVVDSKEPKSNTYTVSRTVAILTPRLNSQCRRPRSSQDNRRVEPPRSFRAMETRADHVSLDSREQCASFAAWREWRIGNGHPQPIAFDLYTVP